MILMWFIFYPVLLHRIEGEGNYVPKEIFGHCTRMVQCNVLKYKWYVYTYKIMLERRIIVPHSVEILLCIILICESVGIKWCCSWCGESLYLNVKDNIVGLVHSIHKYVCVCVCLRAIYVCVA